MYLLVILQNVDWQGHAYARAMERVHVHGVINYAMCVNDCLSSKCFMQYKYVLLLKIKLSLVANLSFSTFIQNTANGLISKT